MAQMTWEKSPQTVPVTKKAGLQWKFVVGGVLLFGAIGFLIISQSIAGAQYFITVKDVLNNSKYVGQTVRVSGAVVGDTIRYDGQKLIMDFRIAHIAPEADNQGEALYQAANDPNATTLAVHIEGQVKPDLLKHEAQAIVTGKIGSDGVFRATELLLKCPSRFADSDPNSVVLTPGVSNAR